MPLSEATQRFIRDYITPYWQKVETFHLGDIIKKLIMILEKYGHNPSILSDRRDLESVSLRCVRDKLETVSLKDHTYRVTANFITLLKEKEPMYTSVMPKAIIIGLAHDIGKIPELRRSSLYTNIHDHEIISANELLTMLAGTKTFFSPRIFTTPVTEHHLPLPEDRFSLLLKSADMAARQTELLPFTPNNMIPPFEEWFSIKTFYQKIEPHINHMRSSKKWDAFTFRGIIYLRPELIYKVTRAICLEQNILDIRFLDESEKDNAIRKVMEILHKNNLILDIIDPYHFAKRFKIKLVTGYEFIMVLSCIRYVDFLNMRKLESRKIGFFETIRKVIPL